jgi:K+ transporter
LEASFLTIIDEAVARTKTDEIPLPAIIDNLARKKPPTVPGTAIFLTSDVEGAPTALLESLKHYKVLHEQNVILSVPRRPSFLMTRRYSWRASTLASAVW